IFKFLFSVYCLPSCIEQGCHPCTPSGSLDTIPPVGLAIIRSISRAVIPAFTEARPMACLSSCLLEWLPDSFHAVRHSCLPCRTLSCVPAFLHSVFQNCHRERMPANRLA